MNKIFLVLTLLALSSCAINPFEKTSQDISTSSGETSPQQYGVKKQSSAPNIIDGMVATPTYGTGKTQIEIFADFQCPACIMSNQSISPVFEEYAEKGLLTIIYRQFPLTNIHKNAQGDAIAALCSAEQSGYMDYKHELYALERSRSGKTVTDSDRISLAKKIGLNEQTFSDCLTTKKYEKQVAADIALGDSKGVSGTPTIYLDGIKIDMSLFRDVDGFKTFLEKRMQK